MLTDLIKFTVKKECVSDAIEYIKEQIENTRRDEGLVSASAFQSEDDPAVLYMLLQWDDEKSVQAHLQKPYDQIFRDKMDTALAMPVKPVSLRLLI